MNVRPLLATILCIYGKCGPCVYMHHVFLCWHKKKKIKDYQIKKNKKTETNQRTDFEADR